MIERTKNLKIKIKKNLNEKNRVLVGIEPKDNADRERSISKKKKKCIQRIEPSISIGNCGMTAFSQSKGKKKKKMKKAELKKMKI
mgnify:CR=1 FL=1